MKKASKYLKQLFSAVVAAVKERSTAMRTKTSAMRTRLIIFGILRNRRLLMSAINSKVHAIMARARDGGGGRFTAGNGGGEGGGASEHGNAGGGRLLAGGGRKAAAVLQSLPSFVVEQEKRAIVLLSSLPSFNMDREAGGGGDDYGDLAGSPSVSVGGGDREDEKHGAEGGGKQQLLAGAGDADTGHEHDDGEAEFRLEDEIDRAADVFITRFYSQMKLQKLESFKRFCEMLERN